MESEEKVNPLPTASKASNPIPTPSSQPVDTPAMALSLPNPPAIDIEVCCHAYQPHPLSNHDPFQLVSSDELISSSLPYSLEVLSDSALETGTDK